MSWPTVPRIWPSSTGSLIKSVIQTLESLVSQDFITLTYTEGIKLLEKAPVKFEFPVAWGSDIQSEHERYLCENGF
jgi:asparaginyl-tRNA synthetase